jgi:phage tail tape-measure protein
MVGTDEVDVVGGAGFAVVGGLVTTVVWGTASVVGGADTKDVVVAGTLVAVVGVLPEDPPQAAKRRDAIPIAHRRRSGPPSIRYRRDLTLPVSEPVDISDVA